MPVPPASPQLARRAAVHIIRTLRDAGHTAYLAGGCVRDELLGLRPSDYDVATDAPPQRVAELFTRASHVGKSFGVMIVRLTKSDGFDSPVTLEVATFRTEGTYSDARRPDSVEFTDARTDAQRRDFTINALFIDPMDDDRVLDYVGGRADLDAKVIRAVGIPGERLAEDHLRALRAVRFAARLGFTIEPDTVRAIREHASELRGVSVERVGDECRRTMSHLSRAMAAKLLEQLGLSAAIFTGQPDTFPIDANGPLSGLSPRASLRAALAAWALELWPVQSCLETSENSADALRAALALSNEEHAAVRDALVGWRALSHADWLERSVASQKRQLASAWFDDAIELLRATDGPRADRCLERRDELVRTPGGLAPTPWVTGKDLIEIGAAPGPAFREVLDRVYDAQLDTPDSGINNRAQALRLATSLIRSESE